MGLAIEQDLAGYEMSQREFVVVAPAAWRERLAQADWPTLAQQPWIVTPPGTSHSAVSERMFRLHGTSIRPVLEVSNEMLLRAMVAGGLGVGFARREFAEEGAARGAFYIVPHTASQSGLHFAFAQVRRADPLVQVLLTGLRAVIADSGFLPPPP